VPEIDRTDSFREVQSKPASSPQAAGYSKIRAEKRNPTFFAASNQSPLSNPAVPIGARLVPSTPAQRWFEADIISVSIKPPESRPGATV
jgi:hypothetical protein